jgi:protein-disulfide isomerase
MEIKGISIMTYILRHIAKISLFAIFGLFLIQQTNHITASADDISMTKEELSAFIEQYIMDNPEILLKSVEKYNQRKEQEDTAELLNYELTKMSLYNGEKDLIVGNVNGNVTIVEFFDYQCGYCKRAHKVMKNLLEKDSNIKVIYKEYPILGEMSTYAAKVGLSIEDTKKYQIYHDKLMETEDRLTVEKIHSVLDELSLDKEAIKARMESEDIVKYIAFTQNLTEIIAVRGTPAFVIGNEIIRGFIPADQMLEKVKKARENKS